MHLLNELPHSPRAYEAARTAVSEWLNIMSPSPGIRTRGIKNEVEEVAGFGAGRGTREHYNIPGFREHNVSIHLPPMMNFAFHSPNHYLNQDHQCS